jgi:putative nucleotidyltransferase with HDIG domain
MYSFLLRLKRKAKKLLKVQSDTRQKPTLTTRSKTNKVIILFVTSVAIALFYPGEDLYNPLDMPRTGEIAQHDILAPFPITIFKSDKELALERDSRRQKLSYILNYDSAITAGVYIALDDFVSMVDSLRNVASHRPRFETSDAAEVVAARFTLMGQAAIKKALTGTDNLPLLQRRLERLYREEIYPIGVLQELTSLPEGGTSMVLIRRSGLDAAFPRDRLLDVSLANARLLSALNTLAATDSVDVEFYYQVGRNFIQPNLFVDREEYDRRMKAEMAAVSSTKEVVNTNDIIVRAGRKIGEREELVLGEMVKMMRARSVEEGWWRAFLPVLARILLVLIVFSALYFFLYFFRREVYRSNARLLAIFMVFVLQLLLIRVAEMMPIGHSVYLMPVALLPIVITILFDAEIGMLATVILSLLLGIMNRFDFTVVLMTMIIGTAACLTSRHVRKRSHFYRIMFTVMISYGVLIFLVETMKLVPNTDVMLQVVYGSLVGLVSCLLTIGILPFFESLFSITTDITLLELSDLNHPLLKRLALEAPGTYHHSISVGNLSEAAAKRIGANSLLARVGTYYHDIGKIEIPEYFVENQLGVHSKHEQLAPSMSALILAAHVKRGRLLGEEADIPDDVLNFIEEHHGTMVMSYFYNKSIEQGGDPAAIDKFRYPGPKPQVRETGIAMLADAVEAASRTLDDPKPARIHALIQRIINERFQSGELDECPLTLRDLAKIREAFAQILIASFHHRVAYPRKD